MDPAARDGSAALTVFVSAHEPPCAVWLSSYSSRKDECQCILPAPAASCLWLLVEGNHQKAFGMHGTSQKLCLWEGKRGADFLSCKLQPLMSQGTFFSGAEKTQLHHHSYTHTVLLDPRRSRTAGAGPDTGAQPALTLLWGAALPLCLRQLDNMLAAIPGAAGQLELDLTQELSEAFQARLAEHMEAAVGQDPRSTTTGAAKENGDPGPSNRGALDDQAPAPGEA